MKYIERALERKFLRMNEVFKAVMIVGARQVGKSTMLKHFAEKENRTIVSMDDSRLRDLAKTDPVLFFQTYQPPIMIDEVQKAPELFEQIKIICDSSDEKGLFWLTGSQSKKLMKQAGDSLAGRVCILKMYSLSQKEKDAYEDMKSVLEMYARGFEFMPIDIFKAHARNFQIIDGKIMPSLSSIDGLGETAAETIVEATKGGPFLSKDDFRERAKVSQTVADKLEELGILKNLPKSNQISLFDMM